MPHVTHKTILWILFAGTLLLVIGFNLLTPAAGGVLLDTIAADDEAKLSLLTMSASQKAAHFWITLALDMPFPLFYGGLFLGLTLKCFGEKTIWAAIPAALVIPVDLTENVIQLSALRGYLELLWLKEFLTPVKYWLFSLAFVIAAAGLAWSVFKNSGDHGRQRQSRSGEKQ